MPLPLIKMAKIQTLTPPRALQDVKQRKPLSLCSGGNADGAAACEAARQLPANQTAFESPKPGSNQDALQRVSE